MTETIVETDLGNFNFRSIKLANGKKSIAIKKAKKNGAKILCPNLIR
ncbi:Sensor kinase protein rcsC (fragment) [Chryseobacterium sp. 8AT]